MEELLQICTYSTVREADRGEDKGVSGLGPQGEGIV